ncbi:hypothetical protein L4G92_08450 [Neisseria sp. ZJ106]|uniref:Lipoprotein n=1 Tax=Neisseria lisongii TaxID=2912188 RepID=A0ABY7RKR5_9NEIS|nr:hypothetical protein [Neisseria lisongii]MCF7522074.1 hypothetical protein [Neisseria lisongii]WCL71361.1 hypothetical protein PJU73_08520 [Neisseria lisongii]
MKYITLILLTTLLAACSGGFSGKSHSELYGQISTGIESSRTTIGGQ